MPRPLWTGAIAFGLVNIPVRLFSATESHRIAFHEVEEKTGQRIKHKRVAEKSGREVPYDQIVKGFEYSKGRTVVLTDDELRAAEPERDRTITIEQFVALDEIDPISFDSTYYVAPDGQAAARAYALLLQTLRDRKLVAIGRFVMRTKEYLVCLRPYQKIMALETLYFADEIRSPKNLPDIPDHPRVGAAELKMAGQLVNGLTGTWDASAFQDTFRERVLKLVTQKAKGHEIEVPAEEKGGSSNVVDLMAALKASLGGKGQSGKTNGKSDGDSNKKPAGKSDGKRAPAARTGRERTAARARSGGGRRTTARSHRAAQN